VEPPHNGKILFKADALKDMAPRTMVSIMLEQEERDVLT